MTQEQPVVSVIIPVYNAEAYLHRAVESALSQQYDLLEIVLVDDGSTDGTAAICDKLASDNNNIVVVHQRNKGAYAARNAGLDHATGDLIMWLDADDWIGSEWVSMFVEAQRYSDADVVACGSEIGFFRHPVILSQYLLNRIEKTMWITCAKRDVYQGLRFEPHTIGEDALLLCRMMWKTPSLQVIPRTDAYHYEEVATSVSRMQRLGNKLSWPRRAQAELEFVGNTCPQYLSCARFDVMRGAAVMYRSVKRLRVPDDQKATKRTLLRKLRHYIVEGLVHLPLRNMKVREYKQVLVCLRNWFC